MRLLPTALVCLFVGLGAGFAFGRGSAPSPLSAAPPTTPAAASALPSTSSPSPSSTSSAWSRPASEAREGGASERGARDMERLRELELEIARLRGAVDAVAVERKEIEGTPVAFPAGHSAEADERAFHESLKKALAARGLDGEVQALDCTEFPCIAHGLIRKDIDDLTMRGIADDAKRALGWGAPYLSLSRFVDDKNPANSKSGFSVAIYPDDLPPDEQKNMNKRLRDRKNAYTDTAD